MIGVKVQKFRFTNRLFLLLERFQLKLHFTRTIAFLQSRSKKHLSPEIQKAREENVEFLKKYAQNGIFPINTKFKEGKPIFKDNFGTLCAVGAILENRNETKLIDNVVHHDNNIRIKDLDDPHFLTWARKSGLTIDELEMIQPTYGYLEPEPTINPFIFIAIAITVAIFTVLSYKFIKYFIRKKHARKVMYTDRY